MGPFNGQEVGKNLFSGRFRGLGRRKSPSGSGSAEGAGKLGSLDLHVKVGFTWVHFTSVESIWVHVTSFELISPVLSSFPQIDYWKRYFLKLLRPKPQADSSRAYVQYWFQCGQMDSPCLPQHQFTGQIGRWRANGKWSATSFSGL